VEKTASTLAQIHARFEVGQLTLTEVYTQEAQLAASMAKRQKAEGDVEAARAHYEAVVGTQPPEDLSFPEDIPLQLADTCEAAIQASLVNSPQILARKKQEEAALYGVNSEMARQFGPKVSARASAARYINRHSYATPEPSRSNGMQNDLTVGVSFELPLSFGQGQAAVRETEHALTKARFERLKDQLAIRENVIAAWSQVASQKKQLSQYELEVKANKQAFKGVLEEFKLGSKSVYDLNTTQKSLLESQGKLLEGRRNLLLSQVSLATYEGRFVTHSLRLAVRRYDPKGYDPWFGLGYDEAPAVQDQQLKG
jgi:outer membrane protein